MFLPVFFKKSFIVLMLYLLVHDCRKEPELTEITNDGTGGISCLVNGQTLNAYGGPPLSLHPPGESVKMGDLDGAGVFVLRLYNWGDTDKPWQKVEIQLYDIDLQNSQHQYISLEGNTYQLGDYGPPGMHGRHHTFGCYCNGMRGESTEHLFHTSQNYTGELKITHHDLENLIVSGTFWFDAVNENANVVHVTEGRFDIKYSGF